MSDFQKALTVLLAHEVGGAPNGGYTNDPDDAGGATKYGVTQKTLDDYNDAHTPLVTDVKDLTLIGAATVYQDLFWKPLQLDQIQSEWVATVIFDQAVLSGRREVVSVLQKTLGLAADGEMGPLTVSAVNREDERDSLCFRFLRAMYHHYVDVVKARPVDLKYLSGWGDRLFSLMDYVAYGDFT